MPQGQYRDAWRHWIIAAGQDPSVDNFAFVGALIEEFMDVPPLRTPKSRDPNQRAIDENDLRNYRARRKQLEDALTAEGLQYFRGGRIVPTGTVIESTVHGQQNQPLVPPTSIDEVLTPILKGLPRAMSPLTYRRKGLPTLAFDNEYDVQDLLHVLLRPWVKDIRPEEYTPSYAGKSTRMDFLLPDHATVIELKFVRDVTHGKNIGQELQIDIGHYRRHPGCKRLWCVIYDPNHFLVNSDGLAKDLEGPHSQAEQTVDVKLLIL
jgi:hypothetical protein